MLFLILALSLFLGSVGATAWAGGYLGPRRLVALGFASYAGAALLLWM